MPGEPTTFPPPGSRRFRTGADADVDAYLLVDGRFFLFCHLKDEALAADSGYARAVAQAFPGGEVAGVGRALKTAERSLPLDAVWCAPPPAELWALEADVRFRLEPDGALNPGLFLDQRENRRRLTQLAKEALGDGIGEPQEREHDGVLNLFSYTGAFSLAARRAGFHKTTSVDLSQRYLGWERRNFDANFGEAEPAHAPRLIRDDARGFLRRAVKKGAKYRFIVIDPPTFSRGEGIFRVQEDLVPLAKNALCCLADAGPSAVFVSMNDTRWAADDFYATLRGLAKDAGASWELGRTPEEFGAAHPLKSAWLIRA